MHFVLKLSTFLQQKYIIMYHHPPQLETERQLGQRQIIGRVVQVAEEDQATTTPQPEPSVSTAT